MGFHIPTGDKGKSSDCTAMKTSFSYPGTRNISLLKEASISAEQTAQKMLP